MSGQGVDAHFAAHVPHTGGGVPAAGDQDIYGGVERQAVDRRHVAVIIADDLVLFQVPAPHGLVFAAAEQVGIPGTQCDTANRADVSGEGEFEDTGGQVPDLREEERVRLESG